MSPRHRASAAVRLRRAFGALALAGLLASCARPEAAGEHDASVGSAAADAARFKEGRGLQFSAATTTALGLRTVEVAERPLAKSYVVTATVFDAGPPARASALVPPQMGAEWERERPRGAEILAVRRATASALTQVEVVLALAETSPAGESREITLRGPERPVSAVPAAAVLRAAAGTFVYVANGGSWLRTAVKTGATDGAFVEITDGLYPGDTVVAAGVEALWLTELRLTKGGGHSH